MERYVLGDIPFVWKNKNMCLRKSENMALFLSDEKTDTPDILIEENEMNVADFEKAEVLKKTGTYELLKPNGKLFVMNHWASSRFGYGFFVDDLNENSTHKVYVNPQIKDEYPVPAEWFFSTIGLHGMLLGKNAVILHASFIEYRGKAILFAAPSQTGKSTQASLWNEYEGAEIINGDRVLLRKKDNIWMAYGYPCCGSSKICLNKSYPVGAIVLLTQGEENKTESISFSEKVSSLVSGTEIYPWNNDEVVSAFNISEKIADEVPVIKLFCRADFGAVSVLKAEAVKLW